MTHTDLWRAIEKMVQISKQRDAQTSSAQTTQIKK